MYWVRGQRTRPRRACGNQSPHMRAVLQQRKEWFRRALGGVPKIRFCYPEIKVVSTRLQLCARHLLYLYLNIQTLATVTRRSSSLYSNATSPHHRSSDTATSAAHAAKSAWDAACRRIMLICIAVRPSMAAQTATSHWLEHCLQRHRQLLARRPPFPPLPCVTAIVHK